MDFKLYILNINSSPAFGIAWADDQHFIKQEWAAKTHLVQGEYNAINELLVKRKKILLPPLNIKLGLVKQFVKCLDSNSDALSLIREMFPKLSWAKIRCGIFTGPQIRVMLDSVKLEDFMTKAERNAWCKY